MADFWDGLARGCNLHWECEITATKLDAIRSGSPIDRKNVRQHLSFGFGIHR